MAKPGSDFQSEGKLFYKIGEVCELTDTQPYVLRFWESEFPQLAPQTNRSGQRIYRRDDIELILDKRATSIRCPHGDRGGPALVCAQCHIERTIRCIDRHTDQARIG